jgi:antitoxin PrlF
MTSKKYSILMRLFFDCVLIEALKNNTLQPYTTEMSEAAHKLIEGVELDDAMEDA